MKVPDEISALLKSKQGIQLDLGCGKDKQRGFVGMDKLSMPGVDIVWDLERFPWPLPDECASRVMASHLLEHINPTSGDPYLKPLIKLLIDKKVLTEEEAQEKIGNYNSPSSIFLSFMDEVWRILKPDGEFMLAFPYAGSTGFWQDPTHVNGITEITLAYFDPLHQTTKDRLYGLYEPKPWKVDYATWAQNQNMEVLLLKRRDDRSYHGDDKVHHLTKS